MAIKILIIPIALLFSMVVFGQNEKRIYFSDSLFCSIESNHNDTLWHIVKDGYVRDSIVSWSFGRYKKYKDTLYLNCFFSYDHKMKKYEYGKLWSEKVSQDEFYKKTHKANVQQEKDMLPELITKFATDFYRHIDKKYGKVMTVDEMNEVKRAFDDYNQFLAYFPNDSLQFIKTFVSHFETPKNVLYNEAKRNYEHENYGDALLYSRVYVLLYYQGISKNDDDWIYMGDVEEISSVILDLVHEYAYLDEHNYVLLDKFQHSKELFPKTKRYGNVWW